jgi:Tfp pilus assembly protein FimV
MCAVLKVWAALISQAKISLVHQRRRLQRVIRVRSAHMIMSQAMKFLVDQRGQFFERSAVAMAPIRE